MHKWHFIDSHSGSEYIKQYYHCAATEKLPYSSLFIVFCSLRDMIYVSSPLVRFAAAFWLVQHIEMRAQRTKAQRECRTRNRILATADVKVSNDNAEWNVSTEISNCFKLFCNLNRKRAIFNLSHISLVPHFRLPLSAREIGNKWRSYSHHNAIDSHCHNGWRFYCGNLTSAVPNLELNLSIAVWNPIHSIGMRFLI